MPRKCAKQLQNYGFYMEIVKFLDMQTYLVPAFVLSQMVDYFTTHLSNVYLGCLDATKAFVRVYCVALFNKLLVLGFPGGVVNVLYDWYGKIFNCGKME